MTTKAVANKDKEFLERFQRIMAEVPLTKEEAHELCEEVGLDAKASWARIKARVANWEKEKERALRRERFARAEREMAEYQARWLPRIKARAAELLKRPREELWAMWQAMQVAQPVQVFHRKLESMPAEDLALLIARCEVFDAADKEK